MNRYLEALKPKQWIKNLVIFFPMVLSLSFSTDIFVKLVLGFIALCISSSIGYILNDISNIDEDRMNPYKKNRVFASGRLSIKDGKMIENTLFLGLMLLVFVDKIIPLIGTILILIDGLYTKYSRNKRVWDVITISSKYPIRYLLGGFLVGTFFIEWCAPLFFIAVILATMKRKGELIRFKDYAKLQRGVLKKYTEQQLDYIFKIIQIFLVVTTVLCLLKHSMVIPLVTLIPVIGCLQGFYKYINYERSKSLAILKHPAVLVFGGMFFISIILSLYGVIP